MWATMRPLTNNTKLGGKVWSTIVVDHNSPNFHYDQLEKFLGQIGKLVCDVMSEIGTKKEADSVAYGVAYAWFKFVTYYIIDNATSSPMFAVPHGELLILSCAEIIWSINNLSSITGLQALGCSYYDVVYLQGKKGEKFEMKEILSAYFVVSEESRPLKKFSEKCWKWYTCHENILLDSCALSCEGALVLFNWIRRILSLTMYKADSRYLEDKNSITCGDMMWALNWVSLSQFNDCSTMALLLDPQDSNHGDIREDFGHRRKRRNQEEHAKAEGPLTLALPDDIVESHVLPKLTWDSLLRFKCVSRSWRNTISSAHFQCLLREKEDHRIQSFCIFKNYHFKYKEFERKCDDLELATLTTTSPMDMLSCAFYSSCNGFLCLQIITEGQSRVDFVIGNPRTGEWTLLPSPIVPLTQIIPGPGLAVDLSNNPSWYKLAVLANPRDNYGLYVFSSETGKWKASNAVLPELGFEDINWYYFSQSRRNWVYINGLLYWVSIGRKLVWFDLEKDEVGHSAFPCSCDCVYFIGSLKPLCGEQMRLTCTINVDCKRMETYELVDENQWVKLLSIPITSYVSSVQPFPYMGGERQFVSEGRSIVAYNIRTREKTVLVNDYNLYFIGLFAFKMNGSPLPKSAQET